MSGSILTQTGAVTQPSLKTETSSDGYLNSIEYANCCKKNYNSTKCRVEEYVRSQEGNNEYLLEKVFPGRLFNDNFPSSIYAAGVLVGQQCWNINGRRNGANLPNASCFASANEAGGGLNMQAIAGGQDNDYTAIHFGDNYITLLSQSPHLYLIGEPVEITNVAHLGGLVDNTRPSDTNAFALPDNCILIMDDTDVDGNLHFIVRSNGVNQTDENLGALAAQHFEGYIVVSDDGEGVKCILGGTEVVGEVDISGAAYADLRAARLQPYFAVVNRAAAQLRQFHLHDFRMIMDAGGLT